MVKHRYLLPWLKADLSEKMVLLSGPRQSGKTTLAQSLLEGSTGQYLNWDDSEDRKRFLNREWNDSDQLLIFDELHKYSRWKNWLKGLYDTQRRNHQFLVTGSARLDVYRRGGDSLLGRHHSWRLHPFCLAERIPGLEPEEAFKRLLEFGGFPEPFMKADPRHAKRWRVSRRERVLQEDLRDLERVREISLISLLVELLASRVGGAIVVSNLAADLQVAPKTVKHWLELLERMYLTFSVSPYTASLPRAIQKPPKVFFFDNSEVVADSVDVQRGARFENLVAAHLLKRLHFLEDSTGDRFGLHYVRDKEGHEVDFLITKSRKPVCLIEAKWSDNTPSPSLSYFGERLKVSQRIQLCAELKKPLTRNGVTVCHAIDWLSQPLDKPLF